MKILQLSDIHLRGDERLSFGKANTHDTFNQVINHLKELRQQPDMIVITGDLGDNGNPVAYKAVKERLLELPVPVYVVPGNHDKRDLMLEIFDEMCPVKEDIHPYICYTLDEGPVKVIVLDTIIQGKHWGGLSNEVATWLKQQLEKYKDDPVLVFTHHPPFLTGLEIMDEPFENKEQLQGILQQHKNLRLCCGHMHRGIMTNWGGVQVMTCPPVAMLIELDISPEGGDTFYLSDPGYAIHHLAPEGMNTHYCMVPTQASYSGPHPFKYID